MDTTECDMKLPCAASFHFKSSVAGEHFCDHLSAFNFTPIVVDKLSSSADVFVGGANTNSPLFYTKVNAI